jgi:hypothetical protein
MKRILLSLGMLLCMSAPSWAVCAVTNLTVKDAAGSPVTVLAPYADDGSGGSNCSPQIQIKQGGFVAAVTAAGALKVDGSAATQPVSGTLTAVTTITNPVAATQSGTWNITNISGTVSLPTGAATAALQPTNAAQGSTTSGQTGHLILGAVTTAAPAYTTAQSSPLSLDTAGNLRVNVVAGGGAGGTSSSFSATFPATGTAAGAEYLSSPPALTTGQMVALQVTSAGSLHTTVDNATALGQATMSVSSPITFASDQIGSCTGVIPINQTAATDLKTSVAKLNICSVVIVSATAQSVSLVEGTGSVCATGIAALIGGTTASMALPANGGFTSISGLPWLKTQTTADHLCLLQSGAGNVSGIITYLDHS